MKRVHRPAHWFQTVFYAIQLIHLKMKLATINHDNRKVSQNAPEKQKKNKRNWNFQFDLESAPAAVEENTQASNDDDNTPSTSPPQAKPATAAVAAAATSAASTDVARETEASPDDGKSPSTNDEHKHSEKDGGGEKTPHDGEHSRAETPHDESDDEEDNITVTVPKPHTHSSSSSSNTNSYHDYRERQSGMNGRYNRPNINEIESASNQTQSHQVGLRTCTFSIFVVVVFRLMRFVIFSTTIRRHMAATI